MVEKNRITLFGRVFLTGELKAITGLHIGKGTTALAIHDIENPIVRNPLTEEPYIPGSSLKGKMRSLLEKREGAEQNHKIGKNVFIHVCSNPKCKVCSIFGVPGDKAQAPTRLIVRDIPLGDESARELSEAKTDLPYSEIKWEVAIDRATSQATPRPIERVPAGAIFKPVELIYSIYETEDINRFDKLMEAMKLIEDDYLGGLGSRGSGKVKFENITLLCKATKNYTKPITYPKSFPSLDELFIEKEKIKEWLKENIPIEKETN